MTDVLPDAVRQGLEAARAAARKRGNRLCIHDRGTVHRVLRMWDGGFALASGSAAPLRGYVDLYDGPRHLSSCLIVATGEERDGERLYEFKLETPVAEGPPLDYPLEESRPAALIPPAF
ncbi:hypothetical protein [Rubellimicrobium sp. CFH 75288]|uniref:hypothetical protein n=1 Tax=Rubellimicrobium sp. CFH 75288 TaxID=2697034 RepID=UPI0014121C1E|nr:hypothetical protein [Rubellimicrobium sp. CFH 75288]NAZ38067.1 hypothetical protein [Rubellimicrobium sp. CFH 75288]